MSGINSEILASPVFGELRRAIDAEAALRAIPSADAGVAALPIDWNLALYLVSALDEDGGPAQRAIMEVSIGAILSSSSNDDQKTAAALLLERLGNWPSIRLAAERGHVSYDYRKHIPLPLLWDSVSAQIEFTITPASGADFLGSRFQRTFWKQATANEWVSVSAPTSAGKSYVVKRWVADQALNAPDRVVLYIVPTRALIEEVSQELLREPSLSAVHIHTLPWDSTMLEAGSRILVMTQERAQITLEKFPELSPTALFADEAQKVGDGYRGMLLEAVLKECVRRNTDLRAVFASPMTDNPETLLRLAPAGAAGGAVESGSPNVSQNLFWLNPVPRRSPLWSVQMAADGEMQQVATVRLDQEPTPNSKRLAALPAKLSAPSALNVVYANTAAEAETAAKQIFEYLGERATNSDQRVRDLQELVRASVHPQYLLAEVLGRGVAFHYGNMPQPVRVGVEQLFRSGLVRFLVCTSTLLEGVNLPCTNIWVMNPRRGQGNPMNAYDFWNLAGRAGRWGAEFSGNIFCIATSNRTGWPDPPTVRVKEPIEFATSRKLRDAERIAAFISGDGLHPAGRRKDEELESIAAHLLDASSRGELDVALADAPADQRTHLAEMVETTEQSLEVPRWIRRAHPGINPQAIERLYRDLRTKDPASLPLLSPADEGAFERLVRVLARCERNMRAGFGVPANQARLSVLLLNWMKGRPIPWLVNERIAYEKTRNPDGFNVAKCIRHVLEDVEQVARYRAPKFLACYADVVNFIAPPGQDEADRPDISMMLELGVSRTTDVSLMSLGLSRTVTVQVSQLIAEDDLGPEAAASWLEQQDLSSVGLPAIAVREVEERLERRRSRRL